MIIWALIGCGIYSAIAGQETQASICFVGAIICMQIEDSSND